MCEATCSKPSGSVPCSAYQTFWFHWILPRDGIALKKTEAKEAQENKQGQVTILLLRSVLTCAGKSLDQIEVVYSVISGWSYDLPVIRVSLMWQLSWLAEWQLSFLTLTMVLQIQSMTLTTGVRILITVARSSYSWLLWADIIWHPLPSCYFSVRRLQGSNCWCTGETDAWRRGRALVQQQTGAGTLQVTNYK